MNQHFWSSQTDFPLTEQQLPALFWLGDQLPGGFFVYRDNEEQELLYVNSGTLRIFGCETQEEFRALTGNTFRGMIHPEDQAAVQESIEHQIADCANESLDQVEYRILRRDGEVRWVDDYGHHAQMKGYGDVFYVFISDITQRRRMQEERRQMELALLEEKHRSEAKTAFLFNISHDIRTPMTAILGFSELARRHINEPELLADYLEKTVSSSRQMLLIIDDMLEVNQLYSSHLELENKPSRLGEQIGRVLESLRSEAEHHHITLVEDLSLGEEQVLVDQTCFRRILGNLLSNAIKFTPQDGTVTVTARERVEGDRSHLTLTVADTGVGMEPAFMERMYDAFEREESSTQSGLFGTGLGLTIVKNLLDQMGGSISVQSKKGEGSVFTVTLSLPRILSLEDASSISTPSMEPGAQIQRRLLVVEDLEFNRILEETLLEESGFLVECAVHGLEAVEAVKSHPAGYYDLILMDIQMPVMNGYEAAKAIRAMKDKGSLPIVALSANARDEDRLMSRNSGMDDHVAKPFEIDELVAVINEHIAAKST